jgi:hypothetical protein
MLPVVNIPLLKTVPHRFKRGYRALIIRTDTEERRREKEKLMHKIRDVNVEVESRIHVFWDTTLGHWATSLNTEINK